MDNYESNRLYSAPQYLWQEEPKMSNEKTILLFKRFVKEFQLKSIFFYREQFEANIKKSLFFVECQFEHISNFDEKLAELLLFHPEENIPLFEKALKEILLETSMQYKNIDHVPDIQFLLLNKSNPKNLRDLNSKDVNKIVVVSGIVTATTKPNIKASTLCVQCRNCGNLKEIKVKSGFGGVSIPRSCDNTKNKIDNKEKCPLDSYIVDPLRCKYIDQQRLKLQETPETIPTGEIPRSFTIYADRYLVNRVTPGTRVTMIGVYTANEQRDVKDQQFQKSYIKLVGLQIETNKSGKYIFNFTQEDEQRFIEFSKDPKIYEKISKSVASAIYGNEDIKKAVACLLFSGCRKRLQEGVRLRGDIHILLLGDPSTGKSQFLKFVERAAPIAVYTSGKGSSAAGLTASIVKDMSSGEFQLEGGAMVLGDGGIVCIDEFDKMRTQDRVAIHEAMEQQTISVAKAGITTTLNSRCSVLAASNPIHGKLDDLKATQDQIDFQTTILSRFDCIFLCKDVRDSHKDTNLAQHIIDLHITGKNLERNEGEINLTDLKKYIAYARMKCTPKISQEAGALLQNYYVADRKQVADSKSTSRSKNSIPVTVRQLEAIIRISEAIAKMSLSNVVNEGHVKEAHRLFQISTLSAAQAGFSSNEDVPQELVPLIMKIEESIKRRIVIGAKVSYTKLIEELTIQYSSHKAIQYAIINLIKQDLLGFLESRKIIVRKK